MKKALLALMTACTVQAQAQDALFGSQKLPPRQGVVFTVTGDADLPGGDMAKRFGNSYRIGGGAFYKTKSNWMSAKIDFIVGGKIKEDSLMINLRDATGFLITQGGERKGVGTFERGYMIGLQGGKLFNIGKKSSDNGVFTLTSGGVYAA